MRISYPENREISEEEVISWARDLMVDDALDKANLDPEGLAYEAISCTIRESIPRPSIEAAIEYLSDGGYVTFTRTKDY